ncbi:hypothetical protein [Ideonella azotifigens]|nr:hypothetical protein [Ideonella azotifigens]
MKPDVVPRLAALASISDEDFADLVQSMEKLTALVSINESISELTSRLTQCSADEATQILHAVMPLYFAYISDGYTPAEVVAGVEDGLASYRGRELLKTKKSISLLKSRLLSLLGNRRIAMRAKATGLVFERPLVLQEARIISDIRPIFASDKVSNVDAYSIIQTLILDCFENGEDKKFHIAIDAEDIEQLADILNRARDKEKALSKMLEATGVTKIEIK